MKNEFDKFADEYNAQHQASITASGEAPEYFAEYKLRDVRGEYVKQTRSITSGLQILDFGAGIGGSVPFTHKYFENPRLTCLDPSQRSLEIAESRFPSQARYLHFDGKDIPLGSNTFDIAYAMCVFHHIQDEDHVHLLRELHRVIRPGGCLFVFEHNPNNPMTVKVVENCPFDENAILIKSSDLRSKVLDAGFQSVDIRFRIFFPHALKMLRPVEKFLTDIPLGAQYYSVSIK